MTRLEIIESFDEETKAKFVTNCNELNKYLTFDWWLNRKLEPGEEEDISGAFSWGDSPEGFDFWEGIDKQILKK